MHAGKYFKFRHIFNWTKKETLYFIIIAFIPTFVYQILGYRVIIIPWLPVALIGTAVAFITGFKNNASYDRLWEARKIWGAIVNLSRSWGIMTRDFITSVDGKQTLSASELNKIHTRLVYRHIAWLTALRFQLRQAKNWEIQESVHIAKFRESFRVPELENNLDDELNPFLSPEEKDYILGKKNPATHVISLQSKDLKELGEQNLLDNFKHIVLEKKLTELYDQQGQCERIKNFPYPRQYATFNRIFIWLFIFLVPLGMLEEFEAMGNYFIWLTIPFSVLVSWVFYTMEKIGEASENPFEGGVNDTPMAALSRTIELDLRDLLDEKDLPQPIEAVNDILM